MLSSAPFTAIRCASVDIPWNISFREMLLGVSIEYLSRGKREMLS
jgi:hypothetical protein